MREGLTKAHPSLREYWQSVSARRGTVIILWVRGPWLMGYDPVDNPSSVCIWTALIQFSRYVYIFLSRWVFKMSAGGCKGCVLGELEMRHGSDQIHCIHVGNPRRINTKYYIKVYLDTFVSTMTARFTSLSYFWNFRIWINVCWVQ